MVCEKCGKDYPSRHYFKTDTLCNNCADGVTVKNDQNYRTPTEKENEELDNVEEVDSKFLTLLGFGKFIAGMGWFVVIVSVISALASFANIDYPNYILLGFSISGIVTGLINVAFGQLITCFVAIEKNTRMTSEYLKQQLKKG